MIRQSRWSPGILALGAALWAFSPAPLAGAQTLEALSSADPLEDTARIEAEVPETHLDVRELERDLRPRPDTDVVDTVLLFTNQGGGDARVHCAGFDKQGGLVGFAWLRVPNLGLRYVTASRISQNADFIGHVQCAAPGRVRGSAVLVGPELTDLPVRQGRRLFGRMQFLVVATY